MRIDVYDTAEEVAAAAAGLIASRAREAVGERGQFVLAVSGGRTPKAMFHALAKEDVPWHGVYLVQVDERLAPGGHADRNFTAVQESLLSQVPLSADRIHPMPMETADLDAAAEDYGRQLARIAGTPPVIDLVQLGLGTDGHTASLVPGDAALGIVDADIAPTAVYQGRRRMTMTLPMLNRSRHILWVVTGADKAEMLARLLKGDASIPAGRVNQASARVVADRAAASAVGPPLRRG